MSRFAHFPLRCVPVYKAYYQMMSAAGAILIACDQLFTLVVKFLHAPFGAPVPWHPGAYVPHCPPLRYASANVAIQLIN